MKINFGNPSFFRLESKSFEGTLIQVGWSWFVVCVSHGPREWDKQVRPILGHPRLRYPPKGAAIWQIFFVKGILIYFIIYLKGGSRGIKLVNEGGINQQDFHDKSNDHTMCIIKIETKRQYIQYILTNSERHSYPFDKNVTCIA